VTIPVSLVVAPNATTGTPIVEVRATLSGQALRRRRSGGIGLVTGLNLIRIYDTNLTVIPGTGAEVPWLHDAGTSQLDGAVGDGHARFMDNTSTATYRIDLPKNVSGGTIDLDIGNSFTVDTSADNKNWTNRLAQRPAVTDLSNRAYRSIDVNTARDGAWVINIRIGDSFPNDGWGGWLAHLRLALVRG